MLYGLRRQEEGGGMLESKWLKVIAMDLSEVCPAHESLFGETASGRPETRHKVHGIMFDC